VIHLQLENVGGRCNAACTFCPLTDRSYYEVHGRPAGIMSWELYTKIVDEAAGSDKIDQLCITGLGETLLDAMLPKRIKYAREKRPDWFIDYYTNGFSLTRKKFLETSEAGVSCVSVSLNAVRADQHAKIMGVSPKVFDRVVRNIEDAIGSTPRRGHPQIQVKAVMDGTNFTSDDMRSFYYRWGHRSGGGYGQVVLESNWAGENENERTVDYAEACGRALGQIYVTFDGIVTMCCLDPLGNFAREATGHPDGFGDLKAQSLRDVYSSEKYSKFREDHFNNRADTYGACAKCTRV